ncbi:ribosomal protein S5 domain 2-like protein [Pluteus cervinus]|uniref:Ribosomal protein S5 domain 2-like protein n=1 Tax=Pluteus cervinus TaxID=181527 RepID=A0ACD3AT88_9AGAR|nr:ribosomal protein S5 domain 2-like protein [Pluteus cervinus]
MATTSLSKAEKSYIQAGLLATPPQRIDGRDLFDFRTVALETGVAPLSNGSARLNIGKDPQDGGGGTGVIAATKLEVENVEEDGTDGGRLVCSVTCSPAAYPHLSPGALDDLQQDMTTILHQTLSHPSLHPANLGILPRKKAWLLNLDVVVLSDAGNVYDALFMAARAALYDTKVPRTRLVEMHSTKIAQKSWNTTDGMDVDQSAPSGLDTRQAPPAQDFDLVDYWDEGEELDGRTRWPVSITLNIVSSSYFLDGNLQEEAAVPLRILLVFSFLDVNAPTVQATRMLGSGEIQLDQIKSLLSDGQKYAWEIFSSLTAKLKDEDVRRTLKDRERFVTRQ